MQIQENLLLNKKPLYAKGHPCIELWDPDTHEIVKKVEGDNLVFTAAFLESSFYKNIINDLMLTLNDDGTPIDANFPYMRGQVVGMGIPSAAGVGLYQGAYNSANQVLGAQTLSSIRWKFQYDFTTAQANGTIRSIGLTTQYRATQQGYRTLSKFTPTADAKHTSYAMSTCDGRYSYKCTPNTGVVNKWDNILSIETAIDLSAIIGKAGSFAAVCYEPANGRCHIAVTTNPATNNRWYVFSDNTFTTLVTSYAISNLVGWYTYAGYVYGNNIYQPASNNIYKADFVNNTNFSSIAVPTTCNATSAIIENLYQGSSCLYSTYFACGIGCASMRLGIIFDMATESFVAHLLPGGPFNTGACLFKVPNTTTNLITGLTTNVPVCFVSSAVAAKVLDVPVVKTSANGMTVTYELEVFW